MEMQELKQNKTK